MKRAVVRRVRLAPTGLAARSTPTRTYHDDSFGFRPVRAFTLPDCAYLPFLYFVLFW
jgi:hypothetical protein